MTKAICVYCSSSSAVNGEFFRTARELGRLIGERGYTLVYGGTNQGLMGEVAQAVQEYGSKVVGVLPRALYDKGIGYDGLDELVLTTNMRERKALMEERASAFIALAGGFGTLEEILEVLTLKQLQFHNKPIVFINTRGIYEQLLAQFEVLYQEYFAQPDFRQLYFVADDATQALEYIENYRPPRLPSKWFK